MTQRPREGRLCEKEGKKSFLVAISDFSNELLTKPNIKRRDYVWIIPFGK